MSASETKLPNLVAFLCIIAGLLIGAVGGLGEGSVVGGIVAGFGVVPACWGIWAGMQQKTQGAMVWSLLLLFAALGVGGLLLVLKFIDFLR
ncbi:MAG: hypothetical protein AAGC55_33090 [Myxococcota bacterium]